MPLTRANMTRASRIMLPAYVALFSLLGLNYLFTPASRLKLSPGLAYADDLLPLPIWGAMFLVGAALMAVALWWHKRALFEYALLLGGLCMSIWAVLLLAAVLFGDASPAGWAWPAFVAVACAASFRSLVTREKR